MPLRLYKYLPSEFVPAFLERGDLLFRSLSYFRKLEERGRQDLLEGLHMDYPDHDVTLDSADGRIHWKGRAAFLNSVNPDRILVFCLSERLAPELFVEFNADACVEIRDPNEFLARCRRAIARQKRFDLAGLLHGSTEYYAPNAAAKGDVKDPRSIPFFKHVLYSRQAEYRLALALRGGLRLTQRIVRQGFSFEEELANAKPTSRHVFVGRLSDIAEMHQVGVQCPAV